MSRIGAVFDSLSKEQRTQLISGFNEGSSQLIEYEPGKFIGVYVEGVAGYQKLEGNGIWSLLIKGEYQCK